MEFTKEQQNFLDAKLDRLSKSKFRNSFYLKKKDIAYIEKVTISKIEEHARDFISKRLAPAYIPNDGKQTPTKNHPVFIAQHATATCCRSCLFKWHHIPKSRELTEKEQKFIICLIVYWIENQLKKQ